VKSEFQSIKKKIERGGGNYVRGEGKVHGRGWGIIKNLASCEFSPRQDKKSFFDFWMFAKKILISLNKRQQPSSVYLAFTDVSRK